MQPDPGLVWVVQLIAAMAIGWTVALLAVSNRVWPAKPTAADVHVPTIATCRKVSVLLYLAAQEMAEAERQLTLHLRGQGGERSLEDAQERVHNAKTDLTSAETLLKR